MARTIEQTPAGADHGAGGTADPPFRLSDLGIEDLPAFLVFWALAGVVFLQFFTRYVLNDSLAWTEEGARYLLIAVTFLGGGMAVRRRAHIAVEFFLIQLPPRAAGALLIVGDLVSAAFFGFAVWLAWHLVRMMGTQQMAVIDMPMSVLYWVVLAGLAVMCLRALQSAWRRLADRGRGTAAP